MVYSVSLRSAAARATRLNGASAMGAVAMMLAAAAPAQAALVSACSGVALPPSAVTGILQPVLTGIVNPIQTDVNGILGLPIVSALGLPTLNIGLTGPGGLLTTAAAGAPISLAVLKNDGTIFNPASDKCNTTTDSVQLNTPAGISLGGNKITGLGNGPVATAGEINSIALGNGAATDATSTTAVAIGTGASVKANATGAVALGNNATVMANAPGGVAIGNRATVTTASGVALGEDSTDQPAVPTSGATIGGTAYTFAGRNPAGVVSVGSGGEITRQIVNVSAGQVNADSTDAVNGSQLFATNTAVNANTAAIAGNTTTINNFSNGTAGTVQRNPAVANGLVLTATGGTGAVPGAAQTLGNVAPGVIAAGSTDAVDGGQLAATNANVTTNTTAITNLSTGINNGTVGLVQQTGGAPGTGVITVGAGTQGTEVNFQNSAGVYRTLTGVAAGVAPTDAVNVSQLTSTVGAATANSVQYDNAGKTSVTLGGVGAAAPTTVTNVAAGALTPTSTDAVNGSQLAATNANVTTNTTAITNLTNGTAGLVQQTGGAPGAGQITVGAATGGTSVSVAGTDGNRTLTGLNAGVAADDAVTVAQLNGVAAGSLNSVQYDTTEGGARSNTVTLAGGAAGPVTITNVAPGVLTAGSTDAVNGTQLYAVNQQVQGLIGGSLGAFQSNNANAAPAPVASGANSSAGGFGASATGAGSVAVGNGATSTGTGSVAIGQGSTDGGQSRVVSVGSVGSERRITNVAPAINSTDAVNLSQLQSATNSFTTTTNNLQNEINQTNFDLNNVRRRANGGIAGAMAVAGLPQAFEPGKSMIGGAIGYWADQVAFAVGISSIVGDHTVVKAGGSISAQGVGGFNAGVGYQF